MSSAGTRYETVSDGVLDGWPVELQCSTGGKEFYTEWEESFDSFDQMGLKENLLRGIYAYGELGCGTQTT